MNSYNPSTGAATPVFMSHMRLPISFLDKSPSSPRHWNSPLVLPCLHRSNFNPFHSFKVFKVTLILSYIWLQLGDACHQTMVPFQPAPSQPPLTPATFQGVPPNTFKTSACISTHRHDLPSAIEYHTKLLPLKQPQTRLHPPVTTRKFCTSNLLYYSHVLLISATFVPHSMTLGKPENSFCS